jgi:hypothetical protein
MATASDRTLSKPQSSILIERWFVTGLALAMIATSLVGFLPSIIHPAERREPLSALAAAHGIVILAWLLVFLIQSRLIATRHVAWHRRLGLAAIAILAPMIPLAYTTTIALVRRGYDLSGDLTRGIGNDAAYQSVFPLFNTVIFSALAIAALVYRRRPEIHKRLMLFANIELMPAPLLHLIGHSPWLASLPHAIIAVPIFAFVGAAVWSDFWVKGRIHPLTWSLAILRIVSGPLEAGPIGKSTAWHHFVYWLAR